MLPVLEQTPQLVLTINLSQTLVTLPEFYVFQTSKKKALTKLVLFQLSALVMAFGPVLDQSTCKEVKGQCSKH